MRRAIQVKIRLSRDLPPQSCRTRFISLKIKVALQFLVAFFVLLAHLTPGTWSILTLGDTPTAMCLFTASFVCRKCDGSIHGLSRQQQDSQWAKKEITPTWLLWQNNARPFTAGGNKNLLIRICTVNRVKN